MPREFSRARRVEEQLRRDLAELIRVAVKEPGLGLLGITEARLSADLSQAKIFVSVLPDDAELARRSLEALQRRAGRLRKLLAQRMRIRAVPQLRFIHDDLIAKSAALDGVIGRAVAEDRRRARQRADERDGAGMEGGDPKQDGPKQDGPSRDNPRRDGHG